MVSDNAYEDTSVTPLSTPLSLDFELDYDSAYVAALEGDIIARVRDVVHACRAPSLRREHYIRDVKQGNKDGTWKDVSGSAVQFDILQLLRDVDTRRSSTYLVIGSLITLNAVRFYLSRFISLF